MGRATAIRLAAEGAQVFGVDVNADGLADTAAAIDSAGGTFASRVTDVSRRDDVHAAIDETVATYGRLDVAGAIAGIARSEHVGSVTQDQWDLMMGVNVGGCFWTAQAAIPHLLQSEGNLILFASNAGFMGQAYTVPYCASKGAVVNLTRALAMEFIKQPIRINAIAPGGVETPMTSNFDMPDDLDFSLMANYVGMRGMARADDLANVFAFLGSDEASNVHGAIWSVDGGLTAA
ncbi:MAG: SDR family oxidoreductase [Acidimicrobiales bacterium]|nr:SDR family oxidoreductase [Acidimicrobiales bacterium]